MDDTKLNLADLNSPGREPFVRSLGFFVALAVPWQINFSCARDFCLNQRMPLPWPTLCKITNCAVHTNKKYYVHTVACVYPRRLFDRFTNMLSV